MEKVICDVCGTDYPETDAQCPICGCARTDGGQTSAGNTEEAGGYTYTKGGRFSKSNVRKRLKAAQIQPVPVEIPSRIEETEEPDYPEDEDYDEEELDDEPASNRGLIVIVVLLLLAIIAVASYIAIVHFDLFGTADPTTPTINTGSSQTTTAPTEHTGVRVPCTGLTADSKITLVEQGGVMQLTYHLEPIDTTDVPVFESSNPNVATVDSNGRVTAVGNGQAVITITCGSYMKECTVSCVLNGSTEPTEPTNPTEPSEPTDPTEPTEPVVPEPEYQLKLNGVKPAYPIGDYSCEATFRTGAAFTLRVVDGDGKAMNVAWSASKDGYVTIDGNTIKCFKPVTGYITISGTYDGKTYSCIVRINGDPIELPDETPDNPGGDNETENPDEPADPVNVYYLKVNDLDPYNPTGTHSCDVSIKVGETIRLTVVNDMEARMNVTWTASEEGVVSIDGNKIKGASVKNAGVTLTATYDGQTFTCLVRVTA